jgi:hypothetical protein
MTSDAPDWLTSAADSVPARWRIRAPTEDGFCATKVAAAVHVDVVTTVRCMPQWVKCSLFQTPQPQLSVQHPLHALHLMPLQQKVNNRVSTTLKAKDIVQQQQKNEVLLPVASAKYALGAAAVGQLLHHDGMVVAAAPEAALVRIESEIVMWGGQ